MFLWQWQCLSALTQMRGSAWAADWAECDLVKRRFKEQSFITLNPSFVLIKPYCSRVTVQAFSFHLMWRWTCTCSDPLRLISLSWPSSLLSNERLFINDAWLIITCTDEFCTIRLVVCFKPVKFYIWNYTQTNLFLLERFYWNFW